MNTPSIAKPIDLSNDAILAGLRLGNLLWWVANGNLPKGAK